MGWRTMVAITGLTALGLTTGFVALRNNSTADADEAEADVAATAQVEQRTLTQTETFEGILDFGEASSVVAAGSGTLTTAAMDESIVNRGGELFSVNLRPTILMYGEIPFYRELREGVDDGLDITQLQENLLELDFTDDGLLEATGEFDASTRRAVEAWQESLDLEPTGVVAVGDVVFLSGPIRIAGTQVPIGSPVQPGTAVVDYTSTTQEVRVELEVDQGDLAAVDDVVEVVLPDGTQVSGTVTDTAHRSPTGGGDSGSGMGSDDEAEADPVVEVTIVLDDTEAAEDYISASVEVVFTRSETEDVLTVPVTALLAAEGGGYALEVVSESGDTTDDSQPATTLVRVELGTNADGFVEIQGDIAEGDEVVVAA